MDPLIKVSLKSASSITTNRLAAGRRAWVVCFGVIFASGAQNKEHRNMRLHDY